MGESKGRLSAYQGRLLPSLVLFSVHCFWTGYNGDFQTHQKLLFKTCFTDVTTWLNLRWILFAENLRSSLKLKFPKFDWKHQYTVCCFFCDKILGMAKKILLNGLMNSPQPSFNFSTKKRHTVSYKVCLQ
jgi:hypothetical protein